jgi:MoaA/NifB/PqqE/SkfB family radical SAM enzyme
MLDYVSLNLPFRCNYRCTKCASLERNIKREAGSSLGLDEIKAIHAEARNRGTRVLAFMGEGEPLVEPLLPAIVSHASSIGLLPLVFTNGSRLNGQISGMLSASAASLIVNIDSLDEGKYGKLSGGGSLETVLDNLKQAKELFAPHLENQCEYVRIAINMVVSKSNINEIPDLFSYCDQNGFMFSSNLPIHIGKAGGQPEFLLGPSEIEIVKRFSQPFGTDSNGQCAFLRNGITYSMVDGMLLPCPYALETEGRYGILDKKDLFGSQRSVLDGIRMFEDRFGRGRCLLRHKDYGTFSKPDS